MLSLVGAVDTSGTLTPVHACRQSVADPPMDKLCSQDVEDNRGALMPLEVAKGVQWSEPEAPDADVQVCAPESSMAEITLLVKLRRAHKLIMSGR